MTRLILVTFAALGWTFYIMSGGPDFEPRGIRTAEPQRVATVAPAKPPVSASAPAEELVTRVALGQTAEIEILAEPEPELPEPELNAEETKFLLSKVAAGLQANPSLFEDQNVTLTLASLEQGVTALQQIKTDVEPDPVQVSVATEPEKDIREISGTRVNMRDGPGTIYPIIGKASIGQKVEVFGDSGTGWLRLRVLPGQQVGWISASLVRKTID
ncbi:MAG: SH3 domain-containing protein [Pseudomonadota bacterium]